MPEDGFAEEPRPEGYEEVERWFTEATTGGPRHRGAPAAPAAPEIDRIARLVNQFSALPVPPPETRIEAGHRLQRATAELKTALGDYLAAAEAHNWAKARYIGPEQTRLIDLWNALALSEPYIGPPPNRAHNCGHGIS